MTRFDYVHSLLKKNMFKYGKIIITIESESMFPLMKKGDRVIVCQSETYKIGDIIVFRPLRREHYLSHRVIWKSVKGKYFTKGDRSHMYDEAIDKERILGKIVEIKEKDDKYTFAIEKQRLIGILSLLEIIILSPLIFFPGTWGNRIKVMQKFHNVYYRAIVMPISNRRRKKLCASM